MTDTEIADKVYIEPITLDFVSRIIRKERPGALLPTLGGQTGLNMAIELHESGILEELGVEILGTKLDAIHQAENRDLFRTLMNELGSLFPKVILSIILKKLMRSSKESATRSSFVLLSHLAVLAGGDAITMPTLMKLWRAV